MPHFYKRLTAMVLMCALSLAAVRGLPTIIPASTYGALHYNPIEAAGHDVVMTIDGNPVIAEEYAYYFIDYANAWNSMLASLGMNWSSVWTEEEFLEQIRTSVDQELTERQAAIGLVDQYNVHLTRAQIDEALSMKQASIDSLGGEEEFQTQLSNIGMTEQLFDNRLYNSYIYTRLNDFLFGEGGEYRVPTEEIKTYMNENYLRAKHVLITDATENAEALAAEVAERAKSGENFDSLIAAYGEDPGMAQQPDGYAFKEGDMVDAFYEGTAALAEGEISDPVKSEYGWHIIQRLPFEDDYITQNHDTFAAYMEAYSIDDLLAERAAAMDVVRNDELYNAIDLYTVQDYLYGADDAANGEKEEPAEGSEDPVPADTPEGSADSPESSEPAA